MKTLAFFNGKGGSGKTSFTILMASWLCYHEGRRVCVYDMDSPEFKVWEQRARDLEMKRDPSSQLCRFIPPEWSDQSSWYEVIRLDLSRAAPQELDDFCMHVRSSQEYDYILFDFGAGFHSAGPMISMMRRHLIDLMAVPVYSDKAVLASGLSTVMMARECRQRTLVFWNRTVRGERTDGPKDRLDPLNGLFVSRGIPVASTRIPELTIFRRDASTWHFIKSTACWPQENIRMMCPDLEPLFKEVLGHLDRIEAKENQ